MDIFLDFFHIDNIFGPFSHNFDAFKHGWYIKIEDIFSLCEKFQIFKNFPVRFQFFSLFSILPIIYDHFKVKKLLGNYLQLKLDFWTVCRGFLQGNIDGPSCKCSLCNVISHNEDIKVSHLLNISFFWKNNGTIVISVFEIDITK